MQTTNAIRETTRVTKYFHILPDTVDIKSHITPEVRYRGIYEAILKNRVVTLMVGGNLVILYAYLYILLQLEDYALLMGSIGLFSVLSVIMYLTRKIDWYASSQEIRNSNPAQPLDATTR